MKIKKIGIFGGSFDPIHNTHLRIIREVIEQGLVDDVWVMPCKQHAFDKKSTDFKKRVKMIQLALKNFKKAKVSKFESTLKGKTYTYKTVKALKKKYPKHEFLWIIGSDILQEINKWKNYKELIKKIEFILFEREGYPIENKYNLKLKKIIKKNINNISSTKIRQQVNKKESLIGLVPQYIEKYIKQEELYKT